MAKITTLFQPQGSLGDTVFRRLKDGRIIAYLKGHLDKEAWRRNEDAVRSHENAQEFGGAAKCGSAIYRTLTMGKDKAIFRPYAHNYIAKKLRANAQRPSHRRAAEQYTFAAAIPALRNLDLSHKEGPSRCLKLTPIGPNHRPDRLKIQGIREAAHQIDPSGSLQLEFRITRKTIRFPELQYDPQKWEWNRTDDKTLIPDEILTTPWVPSEAFPKEGLTITLCHPERSEGSSKQPTTAERSEGQTSSPRELSAAPGGQLEPGAQTLTQTLSRAKRRISMVSTSNSEAAPGSELSDLVFLLIEWRQIKGKGRHPKLIHDKAIVRLAAIRTSDTHAQEMAISGQQTTKRKRRYRKLPPATPIQRHKHKNPELFLKIAFNNLLAPG